MFRWFEKYIQPCLLVSRTKVLWWGCNIASSLMRIIWELWCHNLFIFKEWSVLKVPIILLDSEIVLHKVSSAEVFELKVPLLLTSSNDSVLKTKVNKWRKEGKKSKKQNEKSQHRSNDKIIAKQGARDTPRKAVVAWNFSNMFLLSSMTSSYNF